MFRRAKQWSVGAVSIVALLAGMSGAYAQAQSGDGMTSFETYLREGTESQKNGEYRKAIEKFEKAAAIVDHPRLQMEIGQAYQQLGECKNARSTYEALGGRPELDAQYVDGIKERLASLESCVEYGELSVECSLSGVEVELVPVNKQADSDSEDQTVSGVCPGHWRLPEGKYTLTARADGLEDVQREVSVVGGTSAKEQVRFHESMAIDVPTKGGSSFSDWGVYAGAGAAGLGAVLTTIAVISDSNSGERLQELQKLEQAGNTKLFNERSSENESIRTRNIALYAGGAALLLGGGGVLVWTLLSPDSQADSNISSNGTTSVNRGISVQLAVQPREIGFRFQW